ncbi:MULTISPECIES: hypothetical protein [unclassified Treponema]|uniref:hypothetical protein n=1 Tax=unclassified Treponema TaxID=2638727 RepID=UPI0020A5DE64|nr:MULTISPECIES: hypothetical protein [unclassified Treponema]UTC68425.1 hypothetical protein E4O06_07285 [Treponema sp. OMZ 789]UTC68568.1 hypothetical protein E4O01_07425 [Treponema sp. OMZ 790]UTC71298.1 hypothetical protein E4O02_07615 [Treponema sp. OMZ 791]
MKKNKILCSMFVLFVLVFNLWGNEGKKLLEDYETVLTRIRYSKTSGFCHDGKTRIKEEKVKGSENSFFAEKTNIYLKVKHTKENKVYYTRCFDLKEYGGKLAAAANYQIEPAVKITGHWNFFKIGKKLNITVCSGETCKNTEMTLYEINGEPAEIKDGIFFKFDESKEKKAVNFAIALNEKPMPIIDVKEEEAKMNEILKKMEKHFTAAQIKEKKEAFSKALKALN